MLTNLSDGLCTRTYFAFHSYVWVITNTALVCASRWIINIDNMQAALRELKIFILYFARKYMKLEYVSNANIAYLDDSKLIDLNERFIKFQITCKVAN